MSPEEFQRYKEAEKAHLRKLKELKKAVHTLERQKSLRSAVEKVTEGQDLLERQRELVDELALDTARHEAKLDMALDSADEPESRARTELLEEELQRERAQALVKQLKREMESGDDSEEALEQPRRASDSPDRNARERTPGGTAEKGSAAERDGATRDPTKGRDDRPEKTIGRM